MNEIVSIIIPAYNVEKEIERCVESVLSQTYQKIEVILVNDGSTDKTLEVLRQLEKKDRRIVVVDKKNEGVTKARLTGVKQSTGDWIGFVDGDDYIEPDMFEHLLMNAYKYNADISHCGYQMVFPSRVDYYYNTGRLVKQDKITGMRDLLTGSFVEPGLCNKLFHKNLFYSLLDDNVMDKSIKNFEDLLMNYFLFRESDFSIYEDFCPYHYIVRSESAANSNPHKLHDWIKVTDLLLEETKDNDTLCRIMKSKLIRQLISVSTQNIPNGIDDFQNLKKESLMRLRRNMLSVIFEKEYGIKLRIMTVITCMSPGLYGIIHRWYQRKKGLDKKYDVS